MIVADFRYLRKKSYLCKLKTNVLQCNERYLGCKLIYKTNPMMCFEINPYLCKPDN